MALNFASLKKLSLSLALTSLITAQIAAAVADQPSRVQQILQAPKNAYNKVSAYLATQKAALLAKLPANNYPVLTGVALGTVLTSVAVYYLNARINSQILKKMTPEQAQDLAVTSLVADRARLQKEIADLSSKIDARGFATPTEESDLARLKSKLNTKEAQLVTVLRENKTFLEVVKLILPLEAK